MYFKRKNVTLLGPLCCPSLSLKIEWRYQVEIIIKSRILHKTFKSTHQKIQYSHKIRALWLRGLYDRINSNNQCIHQMRFQHETSQKTYVAGTLLLGTPFSVTASIRLRLHYIPLFLFTVQLYCTVLLYFK